MKLKLISLFWFLCLLTLTVGCQGPRMSGGEVGPELDWGITDEPEQVERVGDWDPYEVSDHE